MGLEYLLYTGDILILSICLNESPSPFTSPQQEQREAPFCANSMFQINHGVIPWANCFLEPNLPCAWHCPKSQGQHKKVQGIPTALNELGV